MASGSSILSRGICGGEDTSSEKRGGVVRSFFYVQKA